MLVRFGERQHSLRFIVSKDKFHPVKFIFGCLSWCGLVSDELLKNGHMVWYKNRNFLKIKII